MVIISGFYKPTNITVGPRPVWVEWKDPQKMVGEWDIVGYSWEIWFDKSSVNGDNEDTME